MPMLLTVNEAATALGCTPRAVRYRLSRGELKGHKDGGRWRIVADALPLTSAQHDAMQRRADDIRKLVDDALPPRKARSRGDKRRTLADLAAFREGLAVLQTLEEKGDAAGAGPHLRRALVCLGRAWPVYHTRRRLELLDEVRTEVGATMACLLLSPDTDGPDLVRRLEERVLPPLAGMCRAAERRARGRAR